jgi:hypothetical protein
VVDTNYRKMWKWPVMFTNSKEEKFVFTPEKDKRLAIQDGKFESKINFKFDFFKK